MKHQTKKRLSELDQGIIDDLGTVLNPYGRLAEKKTCCRNIIENILKEVFVSNVSVEEFDSLNAERQQEKDENKRNKIPYSRRIATYSMENLLDMMYYLMNEKKIIPQNIETNFKFIHYEASKYGAHTPYDESGGLVMNKEGMIICLNSIVEWYFYTYRSFRKEDLPVDSLFENYYDERLPYLNKKTHKGFLITAIASGLLLISSFVFGILYFSEKQDFQKLQTEYTITSSQQEKTIKMFSDSLSKSISAENISNGSVGGDLTFGDKVGGDKFDGDKIENKSVKYNAEKGNIYTIPSGDVTINKNGK